MNTTKEIFNTWQSNNNRRWRHKRLLEIYGDRGIQGLCTGCQRECKVLAGGGKTTFTCFDYMAESVKGATPSAGKE